MSPSPSLHFGQVLLPDGWANEVRLTIADGLIAAIETSALPQAGDERHAIAVSGMPNLHSHAFQRGIAGLAEVRSNGDDSFWTWRDAMYRFVDRMGPDELNAVAALAYMEMLEGGFTRVGEFHYLHHAPDGARYADPAEMSRAIFAAAAETGIGLTHLPVFYAHSGCGGSAPTEGQRRFTHDPDSYARLFAAVRDAAADLPGALVGIAPHSLRAVTPEELAALEAMDASCPVHIHIAEQVREVDECLAWSGARPVEWLLAHAAVDARWCLVHATHLTDTELRGIAASGAAVGLCPVTEANLGDGLFNAVGYRQLGGAFGIGSDSNVLIDATEELRLLEYGQRLMHRQRNLLADPGAHVGDTLWREAAIGGARALGVPGGIAVGASADIVGLDPNHSSLVGRTHGALTDALVFAAGRSAIDTVWRRGERVVSGGRHHARERIVRRYADTLRTLLA